MNVFKIKQSIMNLPNRPNVSCPTGAETECLESCSPDHSSSKKNGFTILEMMVVLLVVVVLLMITLPNIQQKEKIIRAKGCEAQMEVINSQIILYEIDHDETPTDISQLIQEGYLKESQAKCPNGDAVRIVDGEASK